MVQWPKTASAHGCCSFCPIWCSYMGLGFRFCMQKKYALLAILRNGEYSTRC